MKERTLAFFLAIVTVVLIIGPVVLAFSSNNWNVRQVIMPSEEDMSTVEEEIVSLQEPGEFGVVGRELEEETGELEVYVEFDSSADFDIVLKEFYTDLYLDEQDVGEMWLRKDEVVLNSMEATNFTLEGKLEDEFVQLLGSPYEEPGTVSGEIPEASSTGLENLDYMNSTAELEMLGMSLEIKNLNKGGFV